MRAYIHSSEDTRVVEVAEDDVVAEVLSVEVDIWAEGSDEPLAVGVTFAEIVVDGHAAVHVGAGRVDVTVSYNGADQESLFGPGVTLEKVFDWAVDTDEFNIPPADANTLVLRVAGSTQDLQMSTHIGTLADDHRRLHLDLVAGDRFKG